MKKEEEKVLQPQHLHSHKEKAFTQLTNYKQGEGEEKEHVCRKRGEMGGGKGGGGRR